MGNLLPDLGWIYNYFPDWVKDIIWGFTKVKCRGCGWTGRSRQAEGRPSWGIKYLSCKECGGRVDPVEYAEYIAMRE